MSNTDDWLYNDDLDVGVSDVSQESFFVCIFNLFLTLIIFKAWLFGAVILMVWLLLGPWSGMVI